MRAAGIGVRIHDRVERGGGELRAEEEENCGLIFFLFMFHFPPNCYRGDNIYVKKKKKLNSG